MSETEIVIIETAVADIDGVPVSAASIWAEGYTDAAGQEVHGPRATLVVMGSGPEDYDQRVAVDDTVRIAGRSWRVAGISDPESARGTVTLTPAG